MPFVAYCIYAERYLTQLPRNFQRLFSGFLYYSFVTFLVFTGLPC